MNKRTVWNPNTHGNICLLDVFWIEMEFRRPSFTFAPISRRLGHNTSIGGRFTVIHTWWECWQPVWTFGSYFKQNAAIGCGIVYKRNHVDPAVGSSRRGSAGKREYLVGKVVVFLQVLLVSSQPNWTAVSSSPGTSLEIVFSRGVDWTNGGRALNGATFARWFWRLEGVECFGPGFGYIIEWVLILLA